MKNMRPFEFNEQLIKLVVLTKTNMLGYFGGGDSAATTEQPDPNVKAAVDQSTLATMVTNIETQQYERRPGKLKFRKSYGLRDYIFRSLVLGMLFCLAYFPKISSPRHREDAEWLRNFSITMLVWFTFLHAMAYLTG